MARKTMQYFTYVPDIVLGSFKAKRYYDRAILMSKTIRYNGSDLTFIVGEMKIALRLMCPFLAIVIYMYTEKLN